MTCPPEKESSYHVSKIGQRAVRLYNFDGKAVTPENPMVISYREQPDEAGRLYKIITGVDQFTSYEEAEAYLSSQESAKGMSS